MCYEHPRQLEKHTLTTSEGELIWFTATALLVLACKGRATTGTMGAAARMNLNTTESLF